MASVSRLLNHRGRNLWRLFISSLAHSFRHVRIYHLTRTTGEPEIAASFLSSEFKSSRTGVNLWTHIKLQDGISWHHVYKLYFRPPYSKPKCIVKGVPKNVLFFLIVFFGPSPDVDISNTVRPNHLKFCVETDLIWYYSHIKFQIIGINRFRDIDVRSLPRKTGHFLAGHPLLTKSKSLGVLLSCA